MSYLSLRKMILILVNCLLHSVKICIVAGNGMHYTRFFLNWIVLLYTILSVNPQNTTGSRIDGTLCLRDSERHFPAMYLQLTKDVNSFFDVTLVIFKTTKVWWIREARKSSTSKNMSFKHSFFFGGGRNRKRVFATISALYLILCYASL